MKRFTLLLVLLIFFAAETFSMQWELGLRVTNNAGTALRNTVSFY